MGFEGNRDLRRRRPHRVFAMLCDPEVITARFEAAGDTDVEIVRCEADGDGFVVKTKRHRSPSTFPGSPRRCCPPTNRMTMVETWEAADDDGSRNGSFTISVPGTPIRTDGHYELRADGDTTTHTIKGDMEIKIPAHRQETRLVPVGHDHRGGGRRPRLQQGTARLT